jgi:hypothetical protein
MVSVATALPVVLIRCDCSFAAGSALLKAMPMQRTVLLIEANDDNPEYVPMVPAADTRLLHRSTRSLALTEAGRVSTSNPRLR